MERSEVSGTHRSSTSVTMTLSHSTLRSLPSFVKNLPGVDPPDTALRLLDAGAAAVGYFPGFITRGPVLARQILEALRARL